MNIKKWLFWTHKQLGLLLALFFIILGLTGSASVFMREIEPLVHADLLLPDQPENNQLTEVDVDSVLTTFYARPDTENYRVLRLYLPSDKDKVYRIVAVGKKPSGKDSGDFYYHYFSPYDASYLGRHLVKTYNSNQWSMPIMRLLLQVHTQLMAGYYGSVFIGLVGFAFLLLTLIGFYLWIPKNWNKAFSIQWRANLTRLMLDLHKQVGFWAGLVLLLIIFTGTYLVFPDQYKTVVGKVLPMGASEYAGETVYISPPHIIQSYVDYATSVYPNAKNIQVFLHALEKDKLVVRLSQPGEINRTEGKTYLSFAVTTGELLNHQVPASTPTGSRLMNWMLPLHNGEAFGLIGRIIFFIIGLMPLMLFVTAFLVFYRKYKSTGDKGLAGFVRAVLRAR